MTNPQTPQNPQGDSAGNSAGRDRGRRHNSLRSRHSRSRSLHSRLGSSPVTRSLRSRIRRARTRSSSSGSSSMASSSTRSSSTPGRRARVARTRMPCLRWGPFTLREAWFLGASVLVLLASFLPFVGGEYADVFGYASAWAPAPWLAIPAALVLVAAAVLLVLRRLVPGRSFRVGSLSVDQFASAASVATAGFYLGALFFMLGFPAWFGGGSQLLVPGPGVIVGLLFSVLAVVLTTLAPAIPLFRREFSARQEVAAHPVARPAAAVPVRPRVERPTAPQQQAGYAGYPGQPGVPMSRRGLASSRHTSVAVRSRRPPTTRPQRTRWPTQRLRYLRPSPLTPRWMPTASSRKHRRMPTASSWTRRQRPRAGKRRPGRC